MRRTNWLIKSTNFMQRRVAFFYAFRPSLLHSGGGDIKKVRKYGLVHFGFMRSDERSSQQPINVV
jgi:hypothetical protein